MRSVPYDVPAAGIEMDSRAPDETLVIHRIIGSCSSPHDVVLVPFSEYSLVRSLTIIALQPDMRYVAVPLLTTHSPSMSTNVTSS